MRAVDSVVMMDGKVHLDPSLQTLRELSTSQYPLSLGIPETGPLDHVVACTDVLSEGARGPLPSLCSRGVWVPAEGQVKPLVLEGRGLC